VPLEAELVALKELGQDGLGDLTREQLAPEADAPLVLGLQACLGPGSWSRDCTSVGERREQLTDPVDVVAVPVGQVDVGEAPVMAPIGSGSRSARSW
jgi:hypothetical protein